MADESRGGGGDQIWGRTKSLNWIGGERGFGSLLLTIYEILFLCNKMESFDPNCVLPFFEREQVIKFLYEAYIRVWYVSLYRHFASWLRNDVVFRKRTKGSNYNADLARNDSIAGWRRKSKSMFQAFYCNFQNNFCLFLLISASFFL